MATPTVQLNARVPEPLHRALSALARREGTSLAHEVNAALRSHLETHAKRKGAR